MPLLALNEDEEQGEEEEQEEADCSDSEDGDEEDEENERRRRTLSSKFHDRKLVNGIKSKSCFDLQEYQHRWLVIKFIDLSRKKKGKEEKNSFYLYFYF